MAEDREEHRLVHVEPVMGTMVSLDLRLSAQQHADPAGVTDAVAAGTRLLHHVDEVFSTYRPDSAISRLGRGELRVADAPAEVREVLDRCLLARRVTDGAFDAAAGGRLDPSGLVKGWALQRASSLLVERGFDVHCVNGGGDVITSGAPTSGPWRIGITDPRQPGGLLDVVAAQAGRAAVATSGSAERGEHVLDPRTGRPAHGVLSATVVGPGLAEADMLATAVMARPDRAVALGSCRRGYACLVLFTDGRRVASRGWSEPAAA